ncbi:hypothetical protein [Stutzerimonas stutzeri]|uniref:Uncharacterized protein n=1 Tax=Stutzerimonas stutzeri TaxID=316 RepID=A0AA40RU14_STUST|nr:hypothetical protein [Stutzerimonas stutzeri]MBA1306021.1 hypothetical protein [Stutzerimonas stutzeri]
MKAAFTGYAIGDRRAVMVRGYIAVSGVIGAGVGLWLLSPWLILCGGFLLGAFMSPILYVWKDVTSKREQALYESFVDGPYRPVRALYMCVPVVTVLLALLQVADKVTAS